MRLQVRNRRLAALSAFTLVASSALAVTGLQQAVQAYTGTQQIACHLFFGGGLPGTPAGDLSLLSSNTILQIDSLTVSPTNPSQGQTVTVTLASASGFPNGPVAINKGGLLLSAKAVISGAQSGTVDLAAPTFTPSAGPPVVQGGNYPAAAAAAGGSLGAFTLTGTFVASASGSIDVALRELSTIDEGATNADNYCDGTAAGDTPFTTLGNTVGSKNTTSNYTNDPDENGFVTAGFQRTRLTGGAGGAIGWNVPKTWDPQFAPATSATIKQSLTVTGPQPILSLTKNALSFNFAEAGNTLDYEFVIKNTGAAAANGPITVSDPLIPSVDCPATPTLAIDATVKCTGSYTVTADDVTAGEVVNTATATAEGSAVDSNESSATVGIATPGISLTKTANQLSFEKVGDVLTYDLEVTNSGNVPLTDIKVEDALTSDESCPDAPATLNPGESKTCTATYTVTEDDLTAGKVDNSATASGDAGATTITSDEATESVPIGTPSIQMVKASKAEEFNTVGQTIDYTFTVVNNGQTTLTNVAITDDLTTDEACPTTTLAPDADVTCTASYKVTQADLDKGTLTNTATAAGVYRGTTVTSDASTVTINKGGTAVGQDIPSTVTQTFSTINCQSLILAPQPWQDGNVAGGVSGKNPTITLSLTPAVPAPGDPVDMFVQFDEGIAAGPSDINGSIQPAALVTLSGGATGDVILKGVPYQGVPQLTRIPSQRMTKTAAFTFPADEKPVIATLDTIVFDSNVGVSGFNWPQGPTSQFTTVCNKAKEPLNSGVASFTPAGKRSGGVSRAAASSDPIGLQAAVPFTGELPDVDEPDPQPSATPTDDTGGSGSTLPQTGPFGLSMSLFAALMLFQLGLILAVRSVRATPRRRPAHG